VLATVENNRDAVTRLAILSDLQLSADRIQSNDGAVRATARFDLRITAAEETLDIPAELARLRKEKERLEKDIDSKRARLADDAFRSKAPAKIVRQMEATLEERRVELTKVTERLTQLEKLSSGT
jgi:valyl-tRNA synthetase